MEQSLERTGPNERTVQGGRENAPGLLLAHSSKQKPLVSLPASLQGTNVLPKRQELVASSKYAVRGLTVAFALLCKLSGNVKLSLIC